MNILIIGGSGFLGGRIYNYFKSRNFNTKILIRNKNFDSKLYHQNDQITSNFKNLSKLKQVCKNIDVIIHVAGMNSRQSYKKPKEAMYIKKNFTKELIKIAEKQNVKKFFYISTAHVYSNFLNKKYSEKSTTKNTHPYALSNIEGEKILLKHNKNKSKMNIFILRLSNSFGKPIDYRVNCWKLFVNDLCYQSVKDKKMIIAQHPDIKRDFIPIKNFLKVVEFFMKTKNNYSNILFNVGSGKSLKLGEMAKIIRKRVLINLGYLPEIIYKKNYLTEKINTNFVYDINKLKKTKFKNIIKYNKEIDELILFCKKNIRNIDKFNYE